MQGNNAMTIIHLVINANRDISDGNTFYTDVENKTRNEVFTGTFFRAGKLMFSSTKTTPPAATRPCG